MKIFKNINSYRLRAPYIYINEGRNFRLDSKYIELNYNENRIKNTKNFKKFFHFTNTCNYLLFGTASRVYKIDEEIFLNINSYEITNNFGIIRKDERLYNLYNFLVKKNVLTQWLPNSIYHIQDQYWCNDTLEDFKLIDAEKGKILWTIPQPTVDKPYGYQGQNNIKKVLGIYKNNLWLQLPDSRVLALDVASGEVKQEVKHFYFSSIPDGIFLDSKGAIIIFHYNIYAEYNLEEMNFTVDHVIGSENDLIIRQVTHHNRDELLYFTGNKNGSFEPNAYGIFNTNTQTFVFLRERAADMGYFYDAPQVNDEIFAILDNKGNLIIHQLKEVLAY